MEIDKQLEVFTHGRFPRCMAFPYRCNRNRQYFIVNSIKEVTQYIKMHDYTQCYCTMYAFDTYTQIDRNANSAIIDTIIFDLDAENPADALVEAKILVAWATRHGISPILNFSGSKGFHIYLPIVPVKLANARATLRKFMRNLQASVNLTTIDPTVTADLNRVLRLPGTIHQKTGRYVVPIDIKILPYIEMEDILNLAQSSPTYVPERIESFGEIRDYLIDIDKIVTRDKIEYVDTMSKSALGNIMCAGKNIIKCPAVDNLLKNGAQVGILDMCIVGIICAKREQHTVNEIVEMLYEFNKKCNDKITSGHIEEKIRYHINTTYKPCVFLKDVCQECKSCIENNWS